MTAPDNNTDDGGQRQAAHELSVMDAAELAVLNELASPEAVAAFVLVRAQLRPASAHRLRRLLQIVDALSGPAFAENAAAELLDAVTSTGEVELFDKFGHAMDSPIGMLALAQAFARSQTPNLRSA